MLSRPPQPPGDIKLGPHPSKIAVTGSLHHSHHLCSTRAGRSHPQIPFWAPANAFMHQKQPAAAWPPAGGLPALGLRPPRHPKGGLQPHTTRSPPRRGSRGTGYPKMVHTGQREGTRGWCYTQPLRPPHALGVSPIVCWRRVLRHRARFSPACPNFHRVSNRRDSNTNQPGRGNQSLGPNTLEDKNKSTVGSHQHRPLCHPVPCSSPRPRLHPCTPPAEEPPPRFPGCKLLQLENFLSFPRRI